MHLRANGVEYIGAFWVLRRGSTLLVCEILWGLKTKTEWVSTWQGVHKHCVTIKHFVWGTDRNEYPAMPRK
jgi:hypothetical protein